MYVHVLGSKNYCDTRHTLDIWLQNYVFLELAHEHKMMQWDLVFKPR